jgi:hypothetical protein
VAGRRIQPHSFRTITELIARYAFSGKALLDFDNTDFRWMDSIGIPTFIG